MAEQKAPDVGYIHDKLIVECKIRQSDQTKATIKNDHQFDKLLSNIQREFSFLQQIPQSQWTFCVNSTFIDKNQIQSVLSKTPPPAIVHIVWKTRRQPPVKSKVHRVATYLVTVNFDNKQFTHTIHDDKDDWDDETFNNLIFAISNKFNLPEESFNLEGDGEVAVDDIDDINEAFDEFESDSSNSDSDVEPGADNTRKSVNVFVKMKQVKQQVQEMKQQVQEMKQQAPNVIQNPIILEKPKMLQNPKIIQESDKVMSLGHRLKLLAECIKYIKTMSALSENKEDDMKYESELECVLNNLKLKEIAEVERCGEPYTSTIQNICKQISNNNLTTALKQINTIIPHIMPFDFKEFFKLYTATEKTAEKLRNKICWVLLGPTGSGKSTSIHYFCGSHFRAGNGGSVIVDAADKSLKNKDIKVGEQVTESKTRYIEEVGLDLSKYENDIELDRNEEKILWVDSPGFEDTKGPEVNVANGIGTVRALKKAKKVKIIITFKEAHFDFKFKIIRNIANNMGEAIVNLEEELDKKHGSAITGFLTQSNHGIISAQKQFIKAYKEQNEKDEDSNSNTLFKALTNKFSKSKAGSLYEIKIDVNNPKNNETERVRIIKSLVEDVGYINRPNQIFKEFISESSLSKLKEQISNNYDTIENILENDKYFTKPKYIKYIIDILNNVDKLKEIIKSAGGKSVESKLFECVDIFKTKWNNKILQGNNMLTNINIKQCNIHLLEDKLKRFRELKNIMKTNIKVIKKSCEYYEKLNEKSCEYYKELKDITCLNDGLHDCFDEIYQEITGYLNDIRNKLKSDDSDSDVKSDEDAKSSVEYKSEYKHNMQIDDDDYDNDNDNDDNNFKIVLLCIKKCCLLYKQYKDDAYIKKKLKHFERLIQEVVTYLKNKAYGFINSKESKNVNGVSTLLGMFRNLSKLHNIMKIMDEYHSEDDLDGENDKSSTVVIVIKELANKLRTHIDKRIQQICAAYYLQVHDNNNNNNHVVVNYIQILQSKKIKTDEEIKQREDKLVSLCLWLNKLYDSLCGTNLYGISIFKDLEKDLNDMKDKLIKWLCGACIDELKRCNNLLINEGAQSWKKVERLLKECESLRKADYVKNHYETSQEYIKTKSEFESSKTALAKDAEQLIDEFNKNDQNINWSNIIKIVDQLHNAGCSDKSSEMKKIYNKLKEHFNNLKSKTEIIVLSIDTPDDLIEIQSTMAELHTLQKFATFMPVIKQDAAECYKVLNDQVLQVLNEIKWKYDDGMKTENLLILKDNLIQLRNVKSGIDVNTLNDIKKYKSKKLTEFIDVNENKITKLQDENKLIEAKMEEKCGPVMKNITKYEKWVKKGKSIKLDEDFDDDDLKEWLDTVGHKSVKEIKIKLEALKQESNSICSKENKERDMNVNKINEYERTNNEITKWMEIENSLMSLRPGKIIEYRVNNYFLENSISRLEKLLETNQKGCYILTQKLSLYDAYNALKFLSECKVMKWRGDVLSNKYVNEITANVSKYFRAYGNNLESKLNNLIGKLAVTDVPKSDLNDMDYVNDTQNTINKLIDCLREYREISNLDRRIKMPIDDDNNKARQLNLLSYLFSNHEIQLNVDKYINYIISAHKADINSNFNQWKIQRPDKLPVLRYLCLSMSALDRFISLNNKEETYSRIASKIDDQLNKFGDDNTKKITPALKNRSWNQLKQILDVLKKTADANKDGIAQRSYRDAVMQVRGASNKLMNETKSKLLMKINKDSDNIQDEAIYSLNNELNDVKNLVELLHPHLNGKREKDKVKKAANALGLLLSNRLKQLMRAAVQSAKKWDFKQCEKRLDNISKLMDNEISTQFYIINDDNDIKINDDDFTDIQINDNNDIESDIDNDIDDDIDDEDIDNHTEKKDNDIVIEYKKIKKQIDKILEEIREKVQEANESLKDKNVFNPYNRLRLRKLHNQLAKSENQNFMDLWDNIEDDIIETIRSILSEIEQRHNQKQNRRDIQLENKNSEMNKVMTYDQQEMYFRKIDMSCSHFPDGMKEAIQALLTKARECAKGNIKMIDEDFKQFLLTGAWDQVAESLKEFEYNDQKFFQSSKKAVVAKVTEIYKSFTKNMKSMKGFIDNIGELDSYKYIGIHFTKLTYNNNDDSTPQNVMIIPLIQGTLEQMYKELENLFVKGCQDIKSSVDGLKPFKYLKDSFFIITRLLDNKDELPQIVVQNMMFECGQLYRPIQKLINKLKMRKSKGLDKTNNDIDPLINVLDQLKELSDAKFHSNVRKVAPFMNAYMDEKENKMNLEKDIDNIEYPLVVKETQVMLTEFKEDISKEGLNKKIIQKNQAKRLSYLKTLSTKCKSLIKSVDSICVQHFGMTKEEFKKEYIKPCAQQMQKDVKQMQKETFEAFTKEKLKIKDLERANANLEAFYAVKNVFETEINDDEFCKKIQIDEAIDLCLDTATQKVKELREGIQVRNLNNENIDEYMEKCAENLMNLEYLNQHINYQTSTNENEQNELHKEIQHSIKKCMGFLTNNKKTKSKINVLYNHLTGIDSNYGVVFTQSELAGSAFKSALARAMNQKFRELGIDALIQNLQQTEKEMQRQNVYTTAMIGIDYGEIQDIFKQIVDKYNELIMNNLRNARSFEQLQQTNIPSIANDAKSIARRAVRSKTGLLNTMANKMIESGMNFIKSTVSWVKGSDDKNDPRDAYWTADIRGAIPELIPYILAVWTLSNASCYYECDDKKNNTLMKARNAQIIAIICILCLDTNLKQKKLINNLVEVGTGEGKSVIMAITAIVLALLDFDVYCACYSELLSNRDQSAFNDLFIKFGVHNNIKYQTFNNVLEQMINDGGDIREITKNIVLAEDIGHEEKKMDPMDSFCSRQKILFIDEVDKFFSTDFFGKQYTPTSLIPSKEMQNLILFVWNQYVNSNYNGMAISPNTIERSNEYNALLAAFNEEWHDLLRESVKDIVDGIRTYKDDSYKIENGRDIAYKFSDSYSSKVFYGYRTLFTYLHELNNGNINDQEYVYAKLKWFLKCGSFSYSEIPNDFYAILGVTGTLKSLSKKEHQVIQQSYGIKKYIVMPSLFDKSGKLHYAQNKDIDIIKREYFFNTLHGTIQTNLQNDITTIERPIIVFFKDEEALNYFYNLDICETWRINDRIQLLTPDLSPAEKRTGILNATKPNMITFATEEYGRGIDFKVFDKKLDMKGMHVELTYWPDTLAEEIQIKGRTARQGNKGSFHITLNEDAVIDQCKVTSEQIVTHKNNRTVYAWLNQIRDKVFETAYDEASEYVEELKPIHAQSEQLAMSLRTKNIHVAKQKLLLFNKGANIQTAAKLSILIDATGSMGSCLNQCKTVIQKTIPKLVQFLKDNHIDSNSFEIQIIAYRNYDCTVDNILEFCSFTSDENELTKFIHSVKAKNGWGREEAVEIGFGQLNRQEKKPNIVLLMADAPAHTKAEMKRKRQSQYGEEYWQTKRDGIFQNGYDWNEELTQFMNENGNASVFCFYLVNYAKNNFDAIARIGKGKSMYLNVHKQAKSIKLMQSALSETILYKINNGNMDIVQQFRKQNKNMPTFL